MKYYLMVFLVLGALISCDNVKDVFDGVFGSDSEEAFDGDVGPLEKSSEGYVEGRRVRRSRNLMRSACDCIDAVSELDMEDSVAVAAFLEDYEEVCIALVDDESADFSECAETAAYYGYGARDGATATMTACDCATAALKVDMYDDAAVAAFEEEYAACEEVMTIDADYSACEDALAELMGM
ncbi:MAG: hypothetical protein ACPGYR_01600 [Chitinophagales bacterium]